MATPRFSRIEHFQIRGNAKDEDDSFDFDDYFIIGGVEGIFHLFDRDARFVTHLRSGKQMRCTPSTSTSRDYPMPRNTVLNAHNHLITYDEDATAFLTHQIDTVLSYGHLTIMHGSHQIRISNFDDETCSIQVVDGRITALRQVEDRVSLYDTELRAWLPDVYLPLSPLSVRLFTQNCGIAVAKDNAMFIIDLKSGTVVQEDMAGVDSPWKEIALLTKIVRDTVHVVLGSRDEEEIDFYECRFVLPEIMEKLATKRRINRANSNSHPGTSNSTEEVEELKRDVQALKKQLKKSEEQHQAVSAVHLHRIENLEDKVRDLTLELRKIVNRGGI